VTFDLNETQKVQEIVEYGVTHVVSGKEHTGSQKSLDALKTPGCVLVQDSWLFDSYWSISLRDIQPYLIGTGQGNIPKVPAAPSPFLRTSYVNITNNDNVDNNADREQYGGADMMIDNMDYEREEGMDEVDDDDDDSDDLAAAFEEEFMCR
jgi:hypothetical protein